MDGSIINKNLRKISVLITLILAFFVANCSLANNLTFSESQRSAYKELIDNLEDKINKNGGQILLNSKVISLTHNNNIATDIHYEINGEQKIFDADIVISTVPNFELKKIVIFVVRHFSERRLSY